MAVGNTFGATALSSYGGFWIAFGIILTPGGFAIVSTLEGSKGGPPQFYDSFGFFLMVIPYPIDPIITLDSFSLTRLSAGLVHIHHPPLDRHAPFHRRILHPLLHPGPGVPAPRHRIPAP